MSSLCHTALPKHTSFTSPPFTVSLMHTLDAMMFLQHFQGHSGLKAFGSCCSNTLFLQITAQPISSPVTSYSLCSSATFFQIPKQPTPSPPSHNLWSHVTFLFFSFWLCQGACGILVLQPGVEPAPLTLKAWSEPLDHQGSPSCYLFYEAYPDQTN